jgi:regulator of RNase E activity RraA
MAGPAALDPNLVTALLRLPDLSAEFSDLLEKEGYRLVVPATALRQQSAGSRVVGPAITLRYLPERVEAAGLRTADPEGRLGNKQLATLVTPGAVMVVQSPLQDVSVLGSLAAEMLRNAGVAGAVIDGAVRDVEGLASLPFPSWASSTTPITGRWRLAIAEIGGSVAICGVHVQAGDIVVADAGGVAFVPADRFDELAARVLGR